MEAYIHNTPEENGVAEHLNRTLLEKACVRTHCGEKP
jgi:hypothetical protein